MRTKEYMKGFDKAILIIEKFIKDAIEHYNEINNTDNPTEFAFNLQRVVFGKEILGFIANTRDKNEEDS